MAAPAQGDETAHLIYEFERRAYPVRNSVLTIGRDAGSHLLIREPAVSRNHAELRAEDGKFMLHPCGVNPTTVNGMPLTGARALAEGDKVEVGTAILTFTNRRLPLGVAVVEPAVAASREKDVATRRNTIKHPILNTTATEPEEINRFSPKTLLIAMVVIAIVVYFLGK